ncbi:hypothetical protein E4U41_002820, partial [Claviceps citrina]
LDGNPAGCRSSARGAGQPRVRVHCLPRRRGCSRRAHRPGRLPGTGRPDRDPSRAPGARGRGRRGQGPECQEASGQEGAQDRFLDHPAILRPVGRQRRRAGHDQLGRHHRPQLVPGLPGVGPVREGQPELEDGRGGLWHPGWRRCCGGCPRTISVQGQEGWLL